MKPLEKGQAVASTFMQICDENEPGRGEGTLRCWPWCLLEV